MRRGSWGQLLMLATVALILSACAEVMPPYTMGSVKRLPREGAHILVWGDHPMLTGKVTAWLRIRELEAIDGLQLPESRIAEGLRCQRDCDRETVLTAGRMLDAEQVVFLKPSGLPRSERINMEVEGVHATTGEVLWTGSAEEVWESWPTTEEGLHANLARLACHALATVWGLRPAGHLSVPSLDFC